MSSAFRHMPLLREFWHLLVKKAHHPLTNEVSYFFGKCFPFGSSISCAIFQAVSDGIAFIVRLKANKVNINYLDDYLFVAAIKSECDKQIRIFLTICSKINFPVTLEKTCWGTMRLGFLGLLLDSEKQLVCIPIEKLTKALDMIEYFLNKRNKRQQC